MSLPVDIALALASAGIPINVPEEELVAAITHAIGERGGYFVGPEIDEIGYSVELLSPVRQVFEGRTPDLALAWVLIFLMGESGELGIQQFQS